MHVLLITNALDHDETFKHLCSYLYGSAKRRPLCLGLIQREQGSFSGPGFLPVSYTIIFNCT